MNYLFYFCIHLLLIISILCENDFDDNEPYNIEIKYKKYHSLKISFDFSNIDCMDHDKISKDDLIGNAKIEIKS